MEFSSKAAVTLSTRGVFQRFYRPSRNHPGSQELDSELVVFEGAVHCWLAGPHPKDCVTTQRQASGFLGDELQSGFVVGHVRPAVTTVLCVQKDRVVVAAFLFIDFPKQAVRVNSGSRPGDHITVDVGAVDGIYRQSAHLGQGVGIVDCQAFSTIKRRRRIRRNKVFENEQCRVCLRIQVCFSDACRGAEFLLVLPEDAEESWHYSLPHALHAVSVYIRDQDPLFLNLENLDR